MDSIWIQGGKRLDGKIPISGAKNAALTLLPCALLTEDKLTLTNLPRLADVDSFGHLLNQLGVSTTVAGVKSPVEVSAEILRVLRERAELSLGGSLAGAVITVPAYFDDA